MTNKSFKFINCIFLLTITLTITLLSTSCSMISLNTDNEYKKFIESLSLKSVYLKKKEKHTNKDQVIYNSEFDNMKKTSKLTPLKCYSMDILGDNFLSINSLNFNTPDIEELPYYYLDAAFQYKSFNLIEINSISSNFNVVGKIPSNQNEVMISSLLADYIINFYKSNNNSKVFTSYYDIINSKYHLKVTDTKTLKVVGIVKHDLTKHQELKNTFPDKESLVGENVYFPAKDQNNNITYQQFINQTYGYQNIYVTSDFINSLNKNKDQYVKAIYIPNISTEDIIQLSKKYKISQNTGLYISCENSENIVGSINFLNSLSALFLKVGLSLSLLSIFLWILISKKFYPYKKYLTISCSTALIGSVLIVKFINKNLLYSSSFGSLEISPITTILSNMIITITLLLIFFMFNKFKNHTVYN